MLEIENEIDIEIELEIDGSGTSLDPLNEKDLEIKGLESLDLEGLIGSEIDETEGQEETKVEETKVEETKVEETKVEETKVEETEGKIVFGMEAPVVSDKKEQKEVETGVLQEAEGYKKVAEEEPKERERKKEIVELKEDDTFEIKETKKEEKKVEIEEGMVTPYEVDDEVIYPNIQLKTASMPAHTIKLLQKTLQKNHMLGDPMPEGAFQVYISQEKMKISMGYITGEKLKTFLSNPLFERIDKEMYIKEKNRQGNYDIIQIEGDLMYSMGVSSIL